MKTDETTNSKDVWDKAEVCGKVAASVFVPLVAASALYIWNAERTKQQTASSLLPIAIQVLTDSNASKDRALIRAWAISVVNSPSDPPSLTVEAANQLSFSGFDIPDLPMSLEKECQHPSDFLNETDNWEVITGRIGDELINCENRRSIVVDAYDGLAEIFRRTDEAK